MALTVTWYGHAACGVEVAGVRLLIDPFLRHNPMATLKPEDAQADYVLVSHGHSDHVGDTVEIAKRTGATVVANAEMAGWFERQGVKVHEQHIGGGHGYPFGYLKFTPAMHGSGLPDGSYGGNPAGFLLAAPDQKRVYFACDTGLFGDMRLIGEEGIDLALLPIGDNYTMGPADALRAVKLIEPKHVIPIHFNTWPVIAQDPDAWAGRVARETKTLPHVLKPGESFTV